jgi:hypothetical protein
MLLCRPTPSAVLLTSLEPLAVMQQQHLCQQWRMGGLSRLQLGQRGS